MKAILRRTLRDDSGKVFLDDMLDDYINEALADLSLFRPIEYFLSVPFDPVLASEGGIDHLDYAEVTYLWQLEARINRDGQIATVIPYATGEGQFRNGWGWYAERIVLSAWWFLRLGELARLYANDNGDVAVMLALFGYREHKLPDDDADYLDLTDSIDYLCLVRHVKSLAFQSLESDRGLYQQWLAQTNNTDVSPTQLQGMRSQAEQSYERLRKQSARPRRVPTTNVQYVS